MPVYRVPLTGELFFKSSPFDAPPAEDESSVRPAARVRRAHGHTTRRGGGARTPASSGGGRPYETPAAASSSDPSPAPGLGARRQAWPSLFEQPPGAERFLAPPRKSVSGGSLQAIAIYTIGDAMAKYWKAYAELFLKETPGVAFGVHTQAEAAAKLNKLKDTDVIKVYFIGHGYAGGPHPTKPNLLRDPTFMLSGVHSGTRFANNSDPTKNLTPQPGPLIEALAPHLSRDSAVTLYFLSCHTGTDKLMQDGMVQLVRKYAPGVAVTVIAYKQYYGVQQTLHNPMAHVRDKKEGRPPPDSLLTAAPKIPDGYETAIYGDPSKGDDPLKEIDENQTDDPLFGI